jgi:hypothetical protein
MSVLFLDIETIPQHPSFDTCPEEVKKVVKVGVSVDHRVLTIESELTKKSSGSNLLNDIFYNLNYCFIN